RPHISATPPSTHLPYTTLFRSLVAHGDDLGGMLDVLPGQLGDVHEPVHAAEVHEGAEVDDRGHDARTDLALLEGLQEVVADRRLDRKSTRLSSSHVSSSYAVFC